MRGPVTSSAGHFRVPLVATVLAVAVLLFFGVGGAGELISAQANPFIGDGSPVEEEEEDAGAPAAREQRRSGTLLDTAAEFGPPRTALGVWLRGAQRNLTRHLSTTMQAVQRGETTGVFWLIVSLAFIYGVIHSILPGHRKVLLVSYFLARDAKPITGVVAGVALAAVHAAAAVIVVLVAYYVVRTSIGATVVRAGAAVQSVTAGLVLIAGVVLLVLTVREIRSHRHGAHSHGADAALLETQGSGRSQRLLPVIIISGLVPCPGSSMIMLFAVSVGVVALGLIAVGSFAVGMAIVFSAICVATILVKERINRLLESRRGQTLHHAIEIGGALVMVFFGLFLIAPVFL